MFEKLLGECFMSSNEIDTFARVRASEIYSKIFCRCHMHEHVIDGMKLKRERDLFIQEKGSLIYWSYRARNRK